MKTKLWKRVLSLVLAVAMTAPMVLDLIPELGQTVEAVADWIDAGAQGAGREGQLVNGIYEIHVPGTDYMVGIESTADNRALHLQNVNTANRDLQRWVIEYGGDYDKDGNGSKESHWYTVRNLASGMLLSQDGNYFHKTMSSVTDLNYQKWRIVYDTQSRTYAIECWGQYINSWAGYMTPVVKVTNSTDDLYDDSTLSVVNNAYLAGKSAPFGFELKRVGIQDYSDSYQLDYGTYRVGNGNNRWSAITSVGSNTQQNGLGYRQGELTNGTQLYVVDWTSTGYVTVFDGYTGRYIGDRSGTSCVLDGAVAELWDDPSNWFDDRLRFYWIPVPSYSGITMQSSYYLCNVLTGNCLYLVPSTGEYFENGIGDPMAGVIQNSRTERTAWTFTKQSAYQIAANGMNQGYNGNTGVYLDSMDSTNTIKLPIKIYDYVNDGMLFEYAQYVGNDANGNPQPNETIAGKLYSLGNNRAYAFQAGSNGNTWNGLSSGYTNGKNQKGDWNIDCPSLCGQYKKEALCKIIKF